jgi:uncharacterized protein GlcG (DUF336 family)
LDYERARVYLDRALAIAKERGVIVTVAVSDEAGHPVALARGKHWHGAYMAIGKARLSAAFRKPTKDLLEQWKDRPLFPMSLVDTFPGGVTLNSGGCPLVENGTFVGAIAVGGGSPEQDDEIARAAAQWDDAKAAAARGGKA